MERSSHSDKGFSMPDVKDQDLKSSKILVVDDDQASIDLAERLLEWAGYINVVSAVDGQTAIKAFSQDCPDLILLDLHLPGISGFELIEEFLKLNPDDSFLPILIFSGNSSTEAKQKALSLGASDFLCKPGDSTEILLRVNNFLRMRHLYRELRRHTTELETIVEERIKEVEQAHLEIHRRLAFVAEYRDDKTGQHTYRVGDISARIAQQLGWPEEEVDAIRLAAQLHDIGKVGISDSIYLKPDKLTEEEFNEMKKHATIGARILAGGRTPIMRMAEVIAATHHERWDGTGYPKGLAGEDIPLAGRIVAVADVFDALTHERVYKKAMSINEALEIIESESGKHFDPQCVSAMMQVSRSTLFRDEYLMAA